MTYRKLLILPAVLLAAGFGLTACKQETHVHEDKQPASEKVIVHDRDRDADHAHFERSDRTTVEHVGEPDDLKDRDKNYRETTIHKRDVEINE